MDKAQAIHNFWSSFGLTAYDESSIPTGDNSPEMPYITYSVTTGMLNAPVSLHASLWYKSTSWQAITAKAKEIAIRLGTGGATVALDDGYLLLCQGQPFAQRMSDTDDTVRRIYINLQAEFLTAY